MLIVCPSCASEYTIDPATLGADGRTVRCAICRDTWFAGPERPEPDEAPVTAGAVLLGTPPRSRRGARPLALLGAALVLLAVAGPLAVWWGDAEALARGVLRGSDRPAFRDVVSELVGPEGSRTLVVSGEIVNPAGRPVALSPLEFLVRTGDEQVLVAWTSAPPRPDLGPGEAARFEARLPQPPPQGRDVRVHFTRVRGAALAALTDSR